MYFSKKENKYFLKKKKKKCSVCNSKRLKFLKEQEARGLLSSLGIRVPLGKIPLLGSLLF